MNNILAPNERLFGNTPIPVQPTWAIMDSSKTQSLMECPRKFFYEHILGWRWDEPALHLAFGSAWHKAMEILHTEGYSAETVLKAYNAFLRVYQNEMGMSSIELEALHAAKNPSNARIALAEYAARWDSEDRPEDTIHVEIAGTAPIGNNRVIHVKMDTVRRFPPHHQFAGQLHSLEHKTTGRRSKAWEEKWYYLFQPGTYNHALHCAFPDEEVFGVVINGIVFNKTKRQFVRFPLSPSLEMREAWVVDANHWWDYLEWNMKMLYDQQESDRVMVAFPKNSASCSHFGCKHPDLCANVANPLKKCGHPPLGYTEEFWDPRRKEKDAHTIMRASGDDKVTLTEKVEEEDDDEIIL